ncbi:MAG: hypothetical protein Fur0018_09800 [Anaerolineales bacterium]
MRSSILILLLFLGLTACNLPSAQNPATQPPATNIETIAAQTIAAQQTILAGTPQPTITPAPVTLLPLATTPPLPTDTAAPGAPSNTPAPTGTAPAPCNRAAFVSDVTVPDDSQFRPGDTFVKTWRLKNTGTCTWTTDYALAFSEGDKLGTVTEVPLTTSVAPEQTVDLSVNMTAPDALGTYQSDWLLKDAQGNTFGIGDQADKSFWVRIKVTLPGGITFDFLSQASSATWEYDTGTESGSLTYNGTENDPHGAAGIKNGLTLEDGRTTGAVLFTAPPQNNNGVVSGTYPAYKVYRGDRLKGALGFVAESDGSCGTGQAVFIIRYKDTADGTIHTLGQWRHACDRQLVKIDVDLSALAGKEVQFILLLDADGSPQGDRGVWSSLRIER